MKVKTATDIGLAREENQDAVKSQFFGDNVLVVVCDGMGGERAGREASIMAIDEVFARFEGGYCDDLSDDEIRKLLISSISAANSVIYTKARLDFKNFGMGTTCVAAFVTSKTAFIANVGDSRAYIITESGMHRITVDHNVASLLYEQGKITADEMISHPQKNMLIRAVGVEKTVMVDIFILDYENKINLLLCSDGLSGYSTDSEIYEVISGSSFDELSDKLIQLALSKGGQDNVTVALISD
ncbi:MAG: Stp1/IreP family PP2C-type Ser/Thr phosphatase [Oscillospiraceae bacterium]|nr:Stp1/IreP family PP2C-type Ser/Thr phosphatase [Oscillospiraceae bacterium]